MVLTSVKANPSVPIKSLIAEIKNLYGYTITYRKAWLGKQKALALVFAIVEGETREALIWFFELLRQYVTPLPNLCMMTDRRTSIISALQSEEVRWEGDNLVSVYCIHHIASNFNRKLKNAELK